MTEVRSPCSVCGESLYQNVCRCAREYAERMKHRCKYVKWNAISVDKAELSCVCCGRVISTAIAAPHYNVFEMIEFKQILKDIKAEKYNG